MLSHAAISGAPAAGIYSQTLTVGPFFIVLSLSGENVDIELGRNTLVKIEEIVTQTPTISPSELVEMQKEEFGSGIKLNVLVARVENQKLWLAGVGDVSAKLFRGDKVIKLFSGLPVSGTLLHNDFFILGTIQFFENLPAADSKLSPSELRDQILPQVESLADNSRLTALLIRVELQEIETQPVAPTTLPPLPVPRFSFPKLRYPRDLAAGTPLSRKILILSLIILVTLLSLIVFQLRSRVLEERGKVTADIERQVQDGLNSAQKLSGVNDQIARDVLLQTRKDFVSRADATFGKDWPPKLKQLLASLDQQIAAVSKVSPVSTLPVFYDFSLLKSGAKINSLWQHKDEAVILDSGNGAIYSLNLKTKGAAIITGSDDLKTGKFVDSSGDKVYVWTPSGIFSPKQTIKSSDKWGSIKDLKTFAGNIYLLDSQNNQVWKYQNTDLGFSDISNYLHTGMPLDFSNAIGMAIDGAVYILTSTGNIAKFSAGSSDTFKITGLDKPLSNPAGFFVSDETDSVYILDSGNNRVVVLDKKGSYRSQYLLPADPAPTGILVSETLKKVFLTSGAKVYSFDLQ